MGRIKLAAKELMLGRTAEVLGACVLLCAFMLFFGNLPLTFNAVLGIDAIHDFFSDSALLWLAVLLSVLCSVAAVMLLLPLKVGVEYRFYSLTKKETATLKTIFGFFKTKKAFKAVRIQLCLVCIHLFRLAMCLLPSLAVCAGLWYMTVYEPQTVEICTATAICAAVLMIIGFIFAFIYNGSEFLVLYLIFENPDMNVQKAVRTSRRIMEGSLRRLALFKAGFLPWLLLCVMIFPAFYVWGYYKQSLAVLAYKNRDLLTQQ